MTALALLAGVVAVIAAFGALVWFARQRGWLDEDAHR